MIDFYYIKENYLNFLRQYDTSVLDLESYKNKPNAKRKFICGAVFSIKGHDYYAPLSHFKKSVNTKKIKDNFKFIIYDKNNSPKSYINIAYMFPILPSVVNIVDLRQLQQNDSDYAYLVKIELTYCQNYEIQINKFANRVYRRCTRNHYYINSNSCCDFPLLEANYLNYDPNIQYPIIQN